MRQTEFLSVFLFSPGGKGARHWPPSDALELWAKRHGFGEGGGYLVARAIGLRGGLTPRRYLRGGLQESIPHIEDEFDAAAERVVRRLGR